ncbi:MULTISPECIES: hypothetical protein [Arthrobacter]|nr:MULTISPECIES: hypothetical protein [Arthrobacter]NYG16373.1 hypothetical protein [Arthrobacter psychrochitiniphilus]
MVEQQRSIGKARRADWLRTILRAVVSAAVTVAVGAAILVILVGSGQREHLAAKALILLAVTIIVAGGASWMAINARAKKDLSRLCSDVQALAPNTCVYGSAGTFFSPHTPIPALGVSLVPDDTQARPGVAISTDSSGMSFWCRVPGITSVWQLPWKNIEQLSVVRRRIPLRGSYRKPLRTVIRVTLCNESGTLPEEFNIIAGHTGKRSMECAAKETVQTMLESRP